MSKHRLIHLSPPRQGVVQICNTGSAFAALKADGHVVTWGNAAAGGQVPDGTERVSENAHDGR